MTRNRPPLPSRVKRSAPKFRDRNKLVILRAASRAVLKGLLGFLYIKRMHDLRNDNEEE